MTTNPRIVIAGAGSIGCYIGGCLALGGKRVRFLARPAICTALKSAGLRVTDLDGRDRLLSAEKIEVTDDPAIAFADADIVLVTVKSAATDGMAGLIDRFAPGEAIIVSLQNGVDNAKRIRAAMAAKRQVLAGMVPFNVVLSQAKPMRAHRATEGQVLIEDRVPGFALGLTVEGMSIAAHGDITSVLWGKLLLNLNNALNALSGRPLAEQLADRSWRRLLATQMDEALAAMRAADINPAKLAGVPPSLLPTILRLPDWIFKAVAGRMLAIDPEARSSMWEDLTRRRVTEIDEFQGAILRLAASNKTPTPLTSRIVELVRAAETAKQGPPWLLPSQIAE